MMLDAGVVEFMLTSVLVGVLFMELVNHDVGRA
jgi:hypothetical protein